MVEPVIDDSLVLWLNGACGKNSPATRRWVDLSGKGNHGELQNFGFGEGSGWTGEGLWFDEADDYVYCGQVPELNNQCSITLEVFVTFKHLDYIGGTGGLIGILKKGHPDIREPHTGFALAYDNRYNRNSFTYTCFGNTEGGYSGGGNNFPFSRTLDINTMYHFVVTINDSRGKFYIDTELQQERQFENLALVTDSQLQVGRWVGPGGSYPASNIVIYLARIYNRALSPEEVLQNYQAGYTWTPQIGHRTVTSVVKPITASATRKGRGRRDVISTVKPITGSAERKGVGRREVISTVKPITAKVTRKGVGKREVVSTVKPIVSTVNLKLPPIKAVLSLEERVPSLGITERRAEMRITERKPKIEIK